MNNPVILESIIFDNHNLKYDRTKKVYPATNFAVNIPDGQVPNGVSQEYYEGYRSGLLSACADIVITTTLENGEPAVLAIKRSPNKSFANTWYMIGGAIQNYASIESFLRHSVKDEVGIDGFDIEAMVGAYRTTAHDQVADTIALCYVTTIPVEKIRQNIKVNQDHTDWKLLTKNDIDKLPNDERFWHPIHCFKKCLESM